MPGFAPDDPDSRGTGALVSGVIRQASHDDLDAVTFDGGEGILFRASLDGGVSRGEAHGRP